MKQTRALLLVLVVWAMIYLPGLGSLEIKGEEGRRILPAVTMLQTGNYIVPQVGSEPYFRKPPLVNWLVAASFKIFGTRNEWTARLPSVLCVLLVAFAFVSVARSALGANGSLAAALIWMTNFGIIEKGRLIEIEALYVSLGGLAIICWLSWWESKRSRWLTWLVPWIFLGLGLLAKGPLHLLFFYAIVLAVLYRDGELCALLFPQHLLGIVVMCAMFAAWAIPCLQMMHESDVAHRWTREFSGRLAGEGFKFGGWLLNIPRGLGYFLPWLFFLPLLRNAPRERTLAWGIAVPFLLVGLLPGALPRYTMPLLVPAVWLVARLLKGELRVPLIVSGIVCAAMLVYGFALTPFLQRREKVRNIAAQINAALPLGEPLYAIDPDYQPFLFYVRDPIVYLTRVEDAPIDSHYFLVQRADEERVKRTSRWSQSPQAVLRLKDYRNKEVVLLRAPHEV